MKSFSMPLALTMLVLMLAVSPVRGAESAWVGRGADQSLTSGDVRAAVFNDRLWVLGDGELWRSADGLAWERMATPAALLDRHDFALFVTGGKLWMAGGRLGNAGYNDAWSSPDGENWTLERANSTATLTPAGQFARRHSSAHAVFNGQFMQVAGTVYQTPQIGFAADNDIWASANGTTWTLTTSSAAFSSRTLARAVVHNAKLHLIGGLTADGPTSDVWTSSDGTSWSLLTASTPWGSTWGHAATAHDGAIWLAGGLSQSVWRSTDGAAWELKTATAPWRPRWGHEIIGFNGQLYVIGGIPADDFRPAGLEVWRSADGVAWSAVRLADRSVRWSPRMGHASVVHGGRLWMLGGLAFDQDQLTSDVWWSGNGSEWIRHTATAPWGRRWGHVAVTHGGRIWLMGGMTMQGASAQVWSSADGTSWTLEVAAAPWGARAFAAGASHEGRIYMMAGEDIGVAGTISPEIWSSADGRQWRLEGLAPFPGRTGVGLASFGGRLWAVGGHWRDAQGPHVSDEVWSSADGKIWRTDNAALPFALHGMKLVVHEGALLALGGATSNGVSNAIWSSANGIDWTARPMPPWPGRRNFEAVSWDGALWIMGGFERQMLNDVWAFGSFSAAGSEWRRY